MAQFQNENVCLRMPVSLKNRLMELADQREQHVSAIIRQACSELLHREYPRNVPDCLSSNQR
jgi:predicted transcriptional regulator